MHKFNPKTEPATVQIEVNPRRYATIAMIDDKGKIVKQADGKDANFLLSVTGRTPTEGSRMWVPPRVANDLTAQSGGDARRGIPPVAKIINSRTADEALGVVKVDTPAKAEAPTRKKE